MANTFSRIYLQFVFAVKGRQNLISAKYKEELHKYMTRVAQNRKAKMLAIHCMPDHTHLFVGFKPNVLISEFIKEIKIESNEFINSKKWIRGKFNWQDGYGVFFLLTFTNRQCSKIYFKPGSASQEKDIPSGIP